MSTIHFDEGGALHPSPFLPYPQIDGTLLVVSCRSKMCGGIGGDAVIGDVGLAETRIEAAKASKGNGSIAIAIVCVLRAVKN